MEYYRNRLLPGCTYIKPTRAESHHVIRHHQLPAFVSRDHLKDHGVYRR